MRMFSNYVSFCCELRVNLRQVLAVIYMSTNANLLLPTNNRHVQAQHILMNLTLMRISRLHYSVLHAPLVRWNCRNLHGFCIQSCVKWHFLRLFLVTKVIEQFSDTRTVRNQCGWQTKFGVSLMIWSPFYEKPPGQLYSLWWSSHPHIGEFLKS